ncbi:MAG: hypothetical protein LC723_07620, partial [Actinobacteria bacterium]|nr:hypothetical protein [Actinomycetota bacterium]
MIRRDDRDLITVMAIPFAVALFGVFAVIRLFIWKTAPNQALLVILALVVIAAAVTSWGTLLGSIWNPRFLIPIALVFTFTSAYVTLSLDPPGITPYARTFFWNPVKILGADDHLQYRTAQFVYNRLDVQTENFYYQWTITDRTPLAGLAFSEFVRTIGKSLPKTPLYGLPQNLQGWRIPDPYSYWLYRLFIMLANASVIGAVGYLALKRFGRRVSSIAMGVAVVMPFTLLQVMMSYPKMLVAAYLVVALAILMDDGPLWLSGALAGLAYLTHPMALLYLPAMGVILIAKRFGVKKAAMRAVAWLVPIVILAGAWHVWALGTGISSSRTLLYPLGAYTESADPQEVQRVKDQAVRQLREHPFERIVEVRAVSFESTFLSVPDFRCRG